MPEILWNFSRYEDCARITLEQNPHLYLRLPADENPNLPKFQQSYPFQDPSGLLKHNDTVYVHFHRPRNETERKATIFGNVWPLNGLRIFRSLRRVFRSPDSEPHPQLNHSCLWPVATPLADTSVGGTFKERTLWSRPVLHIMRIHGAHGSLASTSSLVCFSCYSNVAHQLLHRIFLHPLQHLNDQDIRYYTRLSTSSTAIYCSKFSITID